MKMFRITVFSLLWAYVGTIVSAVQNQDEMQDSIVISTDILQKGPYTFLEVIVRGERGHPSTPWWNKQVIRRAIIPYESLARAVETKVDSIAVVQDISLRNDVTPSFYPWAISIPIELSITTPIGGLYQKIPCEFNLYLTINTPYARLEKCDFSQGFESSLSIRNPSFYFRDIGIIYKELLDKP